MTDLLKTRPVQIWWLAVGMGITRSICALLVLCLVMFPVPTIEAATRLTFDDGLTLVIQDSDFEADTLNGWFLDVAIYRDDRLLANIARVDITSRKNVSNGRIHVDRLEIENFVARDGGKIGKAFLKNFSVKNIDDLSYEDLSALPDDFSAGIYALEAHDDDVSIWLDRLETTPFKRDVLPSGQSLISHSGFRFDGFRLKPKQASGNQVSANEIIALTGTDILSLSGAVDQRFFDAGMFTGTKVSMRLVIDKVGALGLTLTGRVQTNILELLLAAPSVDEQAEEELGELLMVNSALDEAVLELRDAGVLDRMMQFGAEEKNISKEAFREELNQQLFDALGSVFPREGAALADGVSAFLGKGGTLRLSATPDAPVPLISLATFFMVPDAAVQHLKIRAIHSH